MKKRAILDLDKAQPTETPDGELTKYGLNVAHTYAKKWCRNFTRDLDLERQFPEMEGVFQDIRVDMEYAANHALPVE